MQISPALERFFRAEIHSEFGTAKVATAVESAMQAPPSVFASWLEVPESEVPQYYIELGAVLERYGNVPLEQLVR